MRRRDVLKASALLLGTAASASVSRALLADEPLAAATAEDVFGANRGAGVARLADIIIPPTDTPGAAEAGVGDFIATIYRDWYNDAERASFAAGLDALDAFCRGRDGKAFHESTAANQLAALEDQQAIAASAPRPGAGPFGVPPSAGADAPFFAKLKELVVLGYFTSEIGATRELQFLPAPGRFDGNFDVADLDRPLTQ